MALAIVVCSPGCAPGVCPLLRRCGGGGGGIAIALAFAVAVFLSVLSGRGSGGAPIGVVDRTRAPAVSLDTFPPEYSGGSE